MQTKIYNLFYTGATSANAAAYITIQRPGFISAIHASLQFSAATNLDRIYCELSRSSVSQAAVNDSIGPVYSIAGETVVGATGTHDPAWNDNITNIQIPVAAGDRFYINATEAGTATFYVWIQIYVAE